MVATGEISPISFDALLVAVCGDRPPTASRDVPEIDSGSLGVASVVGPAGRTQLPVFAGRFCT